jgi:hypothetical protein
MKFQKAGTELNANVVGAVRDAERLLASIHESISARQSEISKLEAELGAIALQMSAGELPTGAADELLARLDTAKRSQSMAQAALAPAQARLSAAELQLRRHTLADELKRLRQLTAERDTHAVALANAIAALNEHYVAFYMASEKLHTGWHGKLPPETFVSSGIVHLVETELYRIGAKPFVGSNMSSGLPSLPGGKVQDFRHAGTPHLLTPLVDAVADANRRLIASLEAGAA